VIGTAINHPDLLVGFKILYVSCVNNSLNKMTLEREFLERRNVIRKKPQVPVP